jgi:hypothetical protein
MFLYSRIISSSRIVAVEEELKEENSKEED